MYMKLSKLLQSVFFVAPLVVKTCTRNANFVYQNTFQVILSQFDFLVRGYGASIGSFARSKVKTSVRGQRSRLKLKENALKNIAHILFEKDKIVFRPLTA